MMQTFNATLTPMLTLFMFMIAGFILKKLKVVPRNTATVLSKLENYLIVPALIINTFMKYCTVASISEQYRLILYSLIALALTLGIAIPLSKAFENKDAYKRNIYKYALAFGNFSFMGTAIVPEILGDSALYDYMLYILPLNFAVYTWGLMILIPADEHEHGHLRRLLNPVFVAIFIGAVLGLTGVSKYLPVFLTSTLSGCASCMGPLAMILTGFIIGQYDVVELLKNKKVYAASLLRLLVLPSLFIAVSLLLGADETTLTMCLFAYATPLGLNTVVFPAAYGGDTSIGASMAMISHTICVISIPLMRALLTLIV